MLRTRVVYTGVAGSPYYSTFYWAGDSAELAVAAQEQTIAWIQGLGPFLNSALSCQVESEVLTINEETGVILDLYDVAGSTTIGTNTSNPLPYQTQALTFFGTEAYRFGRRVRGRSFLPGLTEETQSTGAGLLEPPREQIQGAYEALLGTGTANHVVWCRPTTARPVGDIYTVTSWQTSPVWSTLRSRRAA